MPHAAICAKSFAATRPASKPPPRSELNGPYVTPLTSASARRDTGTCREPRALRVGLAQVNPPPAGRPATLARQHVQRLGREVCSSLSGAPEPSDVRASDLQPRCLEAWNLYFTGHNVTSKVNVAFPTAARTLLYRSLTDGQSSGCVAWQRSPLSRVSESGPVRVLAQIELTPADELDESGRRHGRRMDRRWGKAWSPEQIAHRLQVDFPDDESMRISHEAIYQALYNQGRGALRRELTACLRTRRALRSGDQTLPTSYARSLTWDQGSEMSQHAQLRIDTGLPVYFCDTVATTA